MEWKDKLYDYEVTPPENVWNNIVHDLDNDFIHFKEKFQHAVFTPPENAWDNIVHDLDNDFILFKEKLQHTAFTPPENAWDNIQSSLNAVATTLHTTETSETTKTIRLPVVIRMAAAAAVIGILFFTVNYFLNNQQVPNNTAIHQTPSQQPPVADNKKAITPAENLHQEKEKNLIASTYTGKKQNKVQAPSAPAEHFYSDGETFQTPSPAVITETPSTVTDKHDVSGGFGKYVKNSQGEIREDVALLDLPNSYFYMTGPDGQSIRVSAKFRNTIQYLNGSGNEELLDVILRESRYWKNIFSEWKQQVNNSTFVPSANNFMDIAELMQLLHGNTRK
jgi:hypothetical protein